MNKLILTIFFALFIASCSSEQGELIPEKKNEQTYLFNGNEINPEDLDESKDYIYAHFEPNVIQVFDNNESFETYVLELSNQYDEESDEKINLLKIIESNRIASEIAQLKNEEELGEKDAESNSYKILALLEELNNLKKREEDLKTFGISVVIYENINLQGSWKFTSGIVPALNKKWRNRTSSFKALGVGAITLCGKTFFRGNKRFYPVLQYQQIDDLGSFNNRTDSYF